jgi:uncharacterized cupredoxin-like copper-binding protein
MDHSIPARLLALAATFAASLLLAACGEDREEGTTGKTTGTETEATAKGPAVAKVTVGESEFKLKPATPKVGKTGVVQFTARNDGNVVHALEVEGPEGEAETKRIQPGQSATLKVDLSKPGTYEMYCPVDGHKDQGMTGKVVVAGGGTGGGAEKEETETESESGGSGY